MSYVLLLCGKRRTAKPFLCQRSHHYYCDFTLTTRLRICLLRLRRVVSSTLLHRRSTITTLHRRSAVALSLRWSPVSTLVLIVLRGGFAQREEFGEDERRRRGFVGGHGRVEGG